MSLTGIQIILFILILLLFVRTVKRLREGSIRQAAFIGWTLLWVIGGAAVIFPDSTGRIAEIVGVGRGVDVVVYIAVVVLFFLLFKMYNRLNTMEGEITKLVRLLALHDNDEDEKKS